MDTHTAMVIATVVKPLPDIPSYESFNETHY